MVTIILKADIPDTDLQGLKEAAAMALEGLGDFRVVSVTGRRRSSSNLISRRNSSMKELKETAQAANPALEPGQEINEADGEPIFHADEEEGADHEQ